MNRRINSFLTPLFCVLTIFSFCFTLSAQLPSGFFDSSLHGTYNSPMGFTFSKTGQDMFVWEKSGKIWHSKWNGTAYIRQTPAILNISDEVGNWSDFGLIGAAIDPNFASNGFIYLYYQVDRHHLMKFGTPQYDAAVDEYYQASIARVTRYTLNNNGGTFTTDYASRKILLGETATTGIPILYDTHVGGAIVFGADGTLFITTGDVASFDDTGSAADTYFQQAINDGIIRATENVGSYRSQMVNSFAGKLLRIDPNTGDGLASNPHYNATSPRSAASRMWAMGLRQPFRCSFKQGTGSSNPNDGNPGTILISDVQHDSWEELHIIEHKGVNCGWPIYEGIGLHPQFVTKITRNLEETGQPTFLSLCQQPTTATPNTDPKQRRFKHAPPALDWRHGQAIARYPDYSTGSLVPKVIGSAGALVDGTPYGGECSIVGAYYTGTNFPANYTNVFFYADFSENWIKTIEIHDSSTHQVHSVQDFAPAGHCNGIIDIQYCPAAGGFICYLNINTGEIRKITFGGNRPPIAAIASDKTSGISPLVVNFSSTGSFDPDNNPLTYQWNFGDGSPISTDANPTHTFTATGVQGFTVTLTVTDNQGLSDVKTIKVSVNNTLPSVNITNPLNNSTYSLAQISFITPQISITDDDQTDMTFVWQLALHHDAHIHLGTSYAVKTPTIPISPVGCDGETYYYILSVTVTDRGGLTARDEIRINPDCNSSSLAITNLNAIGQNTAVVLTWTNPTIPFDEVMVVAKEGSGFLTNPIGTNYTADTNFTGIGTAFEGGKAVYSGTNNQITVTNLINNRQYYFRVFTRIGTTWTGGVETFATPTGPLQELGCLKASYFNNTDLTGTPSVQRAESAINYEWNGEAPVAGINATNFSARWEGTIIPIVTGSYTFSVKGDDGIRFWVNNQLVIDRWFYTDPSTTTVTIALTQGQNVPIRLEYYQGGGGATAKLSWTLPNQLTEIIAFNPCTFTPDPVQQLGCLKASYFNNRDLLGNPSLQRAESAINNTWDGVIAPVAGINPTDFSVRWEGTIIPIVTGTYTFTVTADDGVRLWVNNQLVMDRWFYVSPSTSTVTVALTQGQNVSVKMEYYQGGGGAAAKLFWTIPNKASDVIAFNPCTFTPDPVQQLGCLKASYFNNRDLLGTPSVQRAESAINNEWNGTTAPIAGINPTDFSVRWEGTVIPIATDTYTFTVNADDGMRLWVNNQLLVDRWFYSSPTTSTVTINLTEGQTVPIKMEYFQGIGGASAKLFWTVPNKSSDVVAFNPCSFTPDPVQQLGCLKASYFNNTDLIGTPSVQRAESAINNEWNGTTAPVAGINPTNFSVRWEGTVIPIVTGTYTFTVNADDGMRLWVNNQLLVDRWFYSSPTTSTVTINLTEGQTVPIKMEYFQGIGGASAKLFWTVPNKSSDVVAFSPCNFTPDPVQQLGCLKASYFNNTDLLGTPSVERAESVINNYWDGVTVPLAGINPTNFSARWEGTVIPIATGTYTFTVSADDGVRLWVNNQLIIDRWFYTSPSTSTATITLTQGENVPIKFEYYQGIGGASAKLFWTVPNKASDIIAFNPCNFTPTVAARATLYNADGYRDGQKGIITWISNANNADYFTVEKQNKSGDFDKLATVNAKPVNGLSNKNYYSYTDNQTFEGENVYRVSLVADKTPPQYSSLISLNFKTLTDFMLYPNPTSDYVEVDLSPYQDRAVVLTLIEVSGKEVRLLKVGKATKTQRLELEGLTAGQYILRIQTVGKRDVTRVFNISK